MNGSVNASPMTPLPPSPNTVSHGAPNATAKESTPLMTLSLAASKNCVHSSETKPWFHKSGRSRLDGAVYVNAFLLVSCSFVKAFIDRAPRVCCSLLVV